jgi:hypothetical protein
MEATAGGAVRRQALEWSGVEGFETAESGPKISRSVGATRCGDSAAVVSSREARGRARSERSSDVGQGGFCRPERAKKPVNDDRC